MCWSKAPRESGVSGNCAVGHGSGDVSNPVDWSHCEHGFQDGLLALGRQVVGFRGRQDTGKVQEHAGKSELDVPNAAGFVPYPGLVFVVDTDGAPVPHYVIQEVFAQVRFARCISRVCADDLRASPPEAWSVGVTSIVYPNSPSARLSKTQSSLTK